LVKVPGRGGARHVKIGPEYLELKLHRDPVAGWAVAAAKPPRELSFDDDALNQAVFERHAKLSAPDRPYMIDLAALIVDALRSRGGRGVATVGLLRRGAAPTDRRADELGLTVSSRISSVADAVDQLSLSAPEKARPALRTIVLRAIADVEGSGDELPAWDVFDARQYLAANYDEIGPADAWLCAALRRSWSGIVRELGSQIAAIDVGTGPNLYTVLAALPHVATIHAYDVAESNRRYLLEQRRELDPAWHQWSRMLGGSAHENAKDLRNLEVQSTSIYDLDTCIADVATMFFCAESITNDSRRFEMGCRALINAVRPGGAVLCAFMLGSSGYATAGLPLPAVPITEALVRDVFAPRVRIEQLEHVPGGAAVRPGHDGMLYLFGWRR